MVMGATTHGPQRSFFRNFFLRTCRKKAYHFYAHEPAPPLLNRPRQLRRNQLNWYFKHLRNTMLRVGNNTTGHTGAKETKRPALSSSAPITSPQLFNSGARPTLRCLRHMHPVRCSNPCTFLIATRAVLVGGNVTTIPFGVGSKSDHT